MSADTRKMIEGIFKNTEKIQKAMKDQNKSNFVKDEDMWSSPWDEKKKAGIATIGFLPFADAFEEQKELSPYVFVPLHSNMVGRNGRKHINVFCPSGKKDMTSNDCPICTKFFEFFNGSEEDKKLASKIGLGRRRNYYCNIVVLKNDSHPEEVGKVFKWRFGQQIQQKINDKINPIDNSDPVMVHNPFDIVPFKLKAIEKNGFRNFDTSEWVLGGKSIADYVMPKASSDEKSKYMEALIEHLFHVSDFVRDDMFKSYDELVDILNDVLLNHGLSSVSKEDGGVESKTVRNNTGTSFPNFSVSSKKNDDEVKEETKEEEEESGDPFSDEEPEDEKESTSSIVDDDLDLDKIFGSDDAPF